MNVDAIAAAAARPLTLPTELSRERASSTETSFGAFLRQALDNLSGLEQEADVAAQQLASGESVDLHNVAIAGEEARIAFELAVQVRNRVVEAYQEVMRMQV